MAEEGVLEATVDTAKRHPWLIGGAIVGLVVVLSLATRKSTTPANFQFSIGPTDTQLKTQAALAIAQDTNATQAGVYGKYFDYLASSGASNNDAAVSIAQINGDTQRYGINQNDAAAVAIASQQYGAATQIASQQYGAATQIAGYQAAAGVQTAQIAGNTQVQVANLNDAAAMYHDQAATAASESHDFTQGVLATIYTQAPSANLAQILQAKASGYLA